VLAPVEDKITHKIFELNPDELRGKEVKIAIVLRDIRVILTKKNNSEMAFVKGEDTTGIIDIVIFPKLYQDIKQLLLDGKVLLLTGKVDTREEEISFLCEKAEEIHQENGNLIKIPKETTKEQLLELKKVMEENQGDDEVILFFEKDNKKIVAKQKVRWDKEFITTCNNVLI
jgi:DNA polymerase-3 subunit alpha